ncbi:hypothetical protein PspLS_00854 [Pyricularia sp. CBS 133598]|nr:hypothetical protein PspLS_00854 [Pyricularia sp. CBS 133598]
MQFKALFSFAALALIPAVSAIGCELFIKPKNDPNSIVKNTCIDKGTSKTFDVNGKSTTVSVDGSCKFSSKNLDPSLQLINEGTCIH